jgi:hypothetical protein
MLATTISLAAGLVLLVAASLRRLMVRLWSPAPRAYVSLEWLTDHTIRDHS